MSILSSRIFSSFIKAFKLLIVFTIFSTLSMAKGSIVNTTVEFSPITFPSGFASSEPWNPVWHYKDSTYIIWIDAKYRPWVTQVKNGVKTTVPLDNQPDYLVQRDGHHRFSIGVDKTGYIHITGDMHHYFDGSTGVITPYPARYQKQIILYWKSNKPEDVSGGFSFAGGNAATAIPGSGWLIGDFFADNNGELYYTSQVHAFEGYTSNNGQMAVGLYRYDTATKMWKVIGAVAPKTFPGINHVRPVFYWEDAGANGGWFQNYQPAFRFDQKNRLHFAVTGNTNSILRGSNRLLYAYSDDQGLTWKKANGTLISGLPLRGIDGVASTADVVADGGTLKTYDALVGMAINHDNTPGISVGYVWYTWNGSAWTTQNPLNVGNNLPVANKGYRMPDNSLVFNNPYGTKLLFTSAFDVKPIGYDYAGYKGVTSLDVNGIRDSGIVYGMGLNPDGVSESVLKTVVTPAPLPQNWDSQDIDNSAAGFAGNAGYLDGNFVLTSYGVSIDDTADSFQYAYTKMNGDGVISARVSLPVSNARAGVMMRETLTPGSKNAAMLIAPYPGNSRAIFNIRANTSGSSYGVTASGITSPYYVRLARAGNLFTGSISPDGVTWKQVSQATVAMGTSIYVGFADSGYGSRWFSQTATFDKTSVPSGGTCTRAKPSFSLTPATQSGVAGSSLNYTVNLTNNDSSTCSSSNFALSAVLPSGFTGSFAQPTVPLAAGASATTVFSAKSPSTAIANTYTLNATATNSSVAGFSANASAGYVVTPSSTCVKNAPTMSFAPSTQTTSGTTPANYVLTVSNNDTASCPARLFQYSMASSSPFVKTFMDPYNVYIDAGKSAPSKVVLTPLTGIKPGTSSVTVTSTMGGSATASLIYAEACVPKEPTITITPATQTASSLTPLTYTVAVTNNDSANCAARLFRYDATPSSHLVKTFMEPYNVYIAPGKTNPSALVLTPLLGIVDGNYTVNVTSNNGGSSTASLVYQASCVQKAPTITISPSSQTVKGLTPATYTATVVNNDTARCATRLFRFTATPSTGYLNTFMEPYNVYIAPGKSNPSKLVLTPEKGMLPGTATVRVISNNGGEGSASLIYQSVKRAASHH